MSVVLRRSVVPALAVIVVVVMGLLTVRQPIDAAEAAGMRAQLGFQVSNLNDAPPGARADRVVSPQLRGLSAWISAVGAAVALADLRGLGRAADYCLVDPRDDGVTVAGVPGQGNPYPSVRLDAGALGADSTVAPMGCVPTDLDEDGDTDLLVYYWGRSPILFVNRGGPARTPRADSFVAADLVTPAQMWNTTALNVVDLDGDGHLDVLVGNYFPDGARVLDPRASDDTRMQMQASMALARNAGTNRILLTNPTGRHDTLPELRDASNALPANVANAWTLAFGAQDLTGDLLPEIYQANDFGPDNLLVNASRPGHVVLRPVLGRRNLTTPKSKVLGRDSFKGMGVTFSYAGAAALPTIFVSNITSPFALQESNFAFVPHGQPADLLAGRVPFTDRSEQLGLSRGGWAWDIKAGDFDNNGSNELMQSTGFVKGKTNRWPELQELAMGNDQLLRFAALWPTLQPGDDLSGHERNPFWVRGPDGRYTDLSNELGIGQPDVSRGIALGDVDGDGRLDALIANQWQNSRLLLNNAKGNRPGIDLALVIPTASGGTRPAIGADVRALAGAAPAQRSQLYPANGHAGVSAAEIHLAAARTGTTQVELRWRDATGTHTARIDVPAGHHQVALNPDGTAVLR